jgi:hypothetical protein
LSGLDAALAVEPNCSRRTDWKFPVKTGFRAIDLLHSKFIAALIAQSGVACEPVQLASMALVT